MTDFQAQFADIPAIADWLAELGIPPDAVAEIDFSNGIVRDKKREEVEQTGWKLWKYGENMTVTIKCLNPPCRHSKEFLRSDLPVKSEKSEEHHD